MPPFWSGKATREPIPGEDGSDDERDELERKHTDTIYRALQRMMRQVAPPGTTTENITPDDAVRRYRDNESILRDALVAMLTDGAMLGADVGRQQTEWYMGVRKAVTVVGVDWDLINEDVLSWVMGGGAMGGGFGDGYANAVTAAMATTSERQLRTLVGEWIRNDLTYRQLIDDMSRTVFSRTRAEMIATTEITRAYAEGNRASWRRGGIINQMRWYTAADERVCPTCGAAHGQISDVNGDFGSGLFPPAHPRCRCFIQPYIQATTNIAVANSYTPSGTPVSTALNIPGRGKYTEHYRNGVDAIDRVHGDGQLPSIPVKTKSNMSANGIYQYYTNGVPAGIDINGKGDHFESTLAHEVGHFLDHMAIGDQGKFASAGSPLMQEWRDAVANSRAAKMLVDKYNSPEKYAQQIEYSIGGDVKQTYTTMPSRKHIAYLSSPEELWARSYAQYVAKRSGNQSMIAQIADERKSVLYGERQWDDEDFIPIEKAIDNLFKGLGWVQ